jgi:hypothetical protein
MKSGERESKFKHKELTVTEDTLIKERTSKNRHYSFIEIDKTVKTRHMS